MISRCGHVKCPEPANLLLALLSAGLLSGCGMSQKTLNGYATLVFFIYLTSAAVAIVIHRLHDRSWFQSWKESTTRLSIPSGILLLVSGIGITLWHAFQRLGFDRTESVPWIFLGVSTAVGGQALIFWAKSTDPEKQKLLLKIVSLSLAFCLALLFLATGGKGLDG